MLDNRIIKKVSGKFGVGVGISLIIIFTLYGFIYSYWYATTMADTSNASVWDVHSVLFFIGLVFVPRITLLVSYIWFGLLTGGTGWWLCWFLRPRLLVAGMASAYYWDTNPVAVVLAWIVALTSFSSGSKDKK